jgi:16S rRNA (uracil1498-N3)-methyltransferase
LHTFFQTNVSTGIFLPEESKHAIRVLRLQQGDEIRISDGKGKIYSAKISTTESGKCAFEIVSTVSVPPRNFSIHLAISPTKNIDRIEWLVEKSVEIGVEKISFLLCATSERKTVNMERIDKVVISALKQSQQAWLPQINQITPFSEFISKSKEAQRFIAHVDSTNPILLANSAKPGVDYVVVIGPEGDFNDKELATALSAGFTKVSLGPNRLRTETAGLVAVAAINQVNLS